MTAQSTPILLFFILLLGGCASVPSVQERRQTLDSIASTNKLHAHTIPTSRFSLYSLSDTSECEDRQMRVYIEGDGFAWATRSRLSDDPTPINPLSARLMMIDPSHCKVYFARPCQYVRSDECKSEYWDKKRFSPEIIESYDEALNGLKQKYHTSSFALVGYSGGGAVAALTASRRSDVSSLVTVAGNLDTDAWVKHHGLSPLEGSLNPADEGKRLSHITQIHFVGAKDSVIPPMMYESYKSRMAHSETIRSVVCDECTHGEGWVERWPSYLKQLQSSISQ